MCLATPLKVLRIEENEAIVGSEAHQHRVDISLILGSVGVGDYILSHNGMAINTVASDDAEKILKMIEESGQTCPTEDNHEHG